MNIKQFSWAWVAMAAAGLTFTACSNEDNGTTPDEPRTTVISFEQQSLNADGFWIGEENATGVDDGWGGKTYTCTYTEAPLTVNTHYAVTYWTGFAISARTETTFASPYGPDQYNNVTGKAHTGKNFLVAQYAYSGETLSFDQPTKVKGLWYTNSCYAVDNILNGDSYTEEAPFTEDDWFAVTITGKKSDGTTAFVEIDLASKGSYVKDWQHADLTSLGEVTSLSFSFSGSRNGAWGLNTPAYVCIDDVEVEL